jgi:hypothetical protein
MSVVNGSIRDGVHSRTYLVHDAFFPPDAITVIVDGILLRHSRGRTYAFLNLFKFATSIAGL